MSLAEGIPRRYGVSALSDLNPELVVALRGLKNKVWFVNSGAAAGGNGASWDSAVTTLQAAIDKADANDIILVAASHAESIIAASGITCNKAGIQIIGQGVGRARPVFTWATSTAATVVVSSANVRFVNLVFRPVGVDAVVTAFSITGADCEFIGCDFEHATSTGQATAVITTTAAADRLTVRDCRFYGSADAGTATCIILVGGDGHRIENNICYGNYTTTLGFIQNVTTAMTNGAILGNFIVNRTASSAVAMTFHASATLIFANNRMGVLTGTAPVVAAAGINGGGNYYSAAAGVSAATLQ